jgi:hypothetical protein
MILFKVFHTRKTGIRMTEPMFTMRSEAYWGERKTHIAKVKQFISECLDRTPERGLTRVELYHTYVKWSGTPVPPATLTDLWIEATNGDWTGWRLKVVE